MELTWAEHELESISTEGRTGIRIVDAGLLRAAEVRFPAPL